MDSILKQLISIAISEVKQTGETMSVNGIVISRESNQIKINY